MMRYTLMKTVTGTSNSKTHGLGFPLLKFTWKRLRGRKMEMICSAYSNETANTRKIVISILSFKLTKKAITIATTLIELRVWQSLKLLIQTLTLIFKQVSKPILSRIILSLSYETYPNVTRSHTILYKVAIQWIVLCTHHNNF